MLYNLHYVKYRIPSLTNQSWPYFGTKNKVSCFKRIFYVDSTKQCPIYVNMTSPSKVSQLGLYLGPLLFILVNYFLSLEGLSDPSKSMLAITLWIATWWITEAIPIAATALLPLVLLPLTGALSIGDTASQYSHPLVLLYMGGFMIAVSIEKWNLHKRIALMTIYLIGSNKRLVVLGFMVATAFLSMWISNTATSLMMLPIGIAVVGQLIGSQEVFEENKLGKALMLGIAYGASIGGMATLIGTPTNILLASVVKELYGYEISFSQWFVFGLPLSAILLFICWVYLVKFAFPIIKTSDTLQTKSLMKKELEKLGPMGLEEKRVAWVFAAVSLAWLTRTFLLNEFFPVLDDTIIAIIGVLLLFVLPSSSGTKLLDWKSAEKIPWGILLLFGGGMSLAEGFKTTGLASWLGSQFVFLDFVAFWLFLLAIIAAVNFLTEVTSNVATASMILPILASVAKAMDVHPFALMVGATLAASCAFMLPVATPPNAVVFGSGFIKMRDMVKAGLWMNLISILVIGVVIYFVLPLLWGIELKGNPF